MTTINLTGTLKDPTGAAASNAFIKIISASVSINDVLKYVPFEVQTGTDGSYDFDLIDGQYAVYIRYEEDGSWVPQGSGTVNSETPFSTGTISDLLDFYAVLTPEELQQMQDLLDQAEQAATNASTSETNAQNSANQAAASATQASEIAGLSDVDSATALNVGPASYEAFQTLRQQQKQSMAGSGVIDKKDAPSGYTVVKDAAGGVLLSKDSLVAADANRQYFIPHTVNAAGMTFQVGDPEADVDFMLMPDAPNGTVTYDSATGAITDYTTDIDPKYGNVAGDDSEAVSRAFEGPELKNGDFRLGNDGWTRQGSATTTTAGATIPAGDSVATAIGNPISAGTVVVQCVVELGDTATDIELSGVVAGALGDLTDGLNTITITLASNDSLVFTNPSGASADAVIKSVSVRPATNQVVTERVDLNMSEFWLEQVSTNGGWIFPYGNVHNQITNRWGIDFVDTSIAQGYSSYGDWDATTIGKGALLSGLTAQQLADFVSDPLNLMSWHPQDGWIQARQRTKGIAGAGNGDWLNVNAMTAGAGDNKTFTVFSDTSFYQAQGISTTSNSYLPTASNSFNSSNSTFNTVAPKELGVFSSVSGAGAYNGECYAMVYGTTPRLNQGAYHPSFNAFGAATLWRSDPNLSPNAEWYSSDGKKVTSEAECFSFGDINVAGQTVPPFVYLTTGSIALGLNGAGRPDGKYYDGLYNSGLNGIIPRLLPAHKQITSELGANVMQDMIAGEYRGEHYLTKFVPFLEFEILDNTYVSASNYMSCDPSTLRILPKELEGETNYVTISTFYRDLGIRDGKCSTASTAAATSYPYLLFLVCEDSGEFWYGNCGNSWMFFSDSTRITFYPYDSANTAKDGQNLSTWFNNVKGNLTNGEKVTVYACLPTNISVSGNYNQTDVIGDPAEILQNPDLVNGWLGSWIPVIPDGTQTEYPLSKKSLDSSSSGRTYTTDDGATWTNSTVSIVTSGNYVIGEIPSNMAQVIPYTANAAMTVEADILPRVDVFTSGVWANSSADIGLGTLLQESLGAGINTDGSGLIISGFRPLSLIPVDSNLSTTWAYYLQLVHTPIVKDTNSAQSAGLKAVKSCQHIVEEDGLLYLMLMWNQMISTTVDFGDDGEILTGTPQTSTKADANGTTVLYGTARSALPIGIAK